MSKHWIDEACDALTASLDPVPSERDELDWKAGISSNEKKLAKHLSAFGNSPGGGYLAFGIQDVSGRLLGVDDPSLVEKIIAKLVDVARTKLEPVPALEHEVHGFRNINILFIKIYESPIKPVHLKGQTIEESYIRALGHTRKMSRQELGRALQQSQVERYEELPAFASANLDEVLQRLDWKTLLTLLSHPLPTSLEKIGEILSREKILKKEGSRWYITNLGVISCAKKMQEYNGHELRGIRVITYNGNSRIKTKREVTGSKGYAVAFEGLFRYVNDLLPSDEELTAAIRRSTPAYPSLTIREILANAAVHQDFHVFTMSPMVEIFSDRIEITSPGNLLPPMKIDRLIDQTPEARNPLFARLMYRAGLCEQRGSGIDKAVNEIEAHHLPPLNFEERNNSFKVTIYAQKKYKDMSKDDKLRACYQHCCLRYVSNSRMTNQSLRERLGVSKGNYPMISRVIADTIELGKIRKFDINSPPKSTSYVPFWA